MARHFPLDDRLRALLASDEVDTWLREQTSHGAAPPRDRTGNSSTVSKMKTKQAGFSRDGCKAERVRRASSTTQLTTPSCRHHPPVW
jgi:hypothetical protein